MTGDHEKRHLFDDPRVVRLVIRGLVVLCAVLVLLDFVIHRHIVHPWEEVFAFYAIFGFVACVVLVLLAKQLRKVVMRSENYYDPTPEPMPFGDQEEQEGEADA